MTDTLPVDYSAMVKYAGIDPFKIDCQISGIGTAANLTDGFEEEAWSRGESAYVIRMPGKRQHYLATVEEGLGTKNKIADDMRVAVTTAYHQDEATPEILKRTVGRSFYYEVAQCNVAMAINDLITVGAAPLNYMLHLAVESDDWFKMTGRAKNLAEGTQMACNLAGCSWGGGETPVLRSIIQYGTSLLSGSAVGYIASKKRLINPANIKSGNAIMLFESSGPQANGISMLWNVVAPRLPNGYLTIIPGTETTFGEAVLAPTIIYSRLIQMLLDAGIHIHYAVNITGHGWAKLMRAKKPFRYVIDRLPRQQPLFDLIEEVNPIGKKKMYKTFNMGAGFAIFIPQNEASLVQVITDNCRDRYKIPFYCRDAGHIEDSPERRVIIDSVGVNVEFGPEDLEIR